MKRAAELIPLSREHHDALALARRACVGADAAVVREDVLRRWSRQIEPHFTVEEKVLLTALEHAGAGAAADVALRQHARLRDLVEAIRQGELAALPAWGHAMREHVQYEERELFELAQARLDLAALKQALARPPNGHLP